MARTRTTKKLAQRIDLNYFKRPTPLKRAKLCLSLLLPLLALVWIAWRSFSGDHRVYSSGRMSRAHAVLEKECTACHDRIPGEFSAKAKMFGCLNCHDGPAHHTEDLAQNDCSSCHSEHRGRVNISATNNQSCAHCHSALRAHRERSEYANRILSLEDGHPEFAALRPVAGVPAGDPGTIKLNHGIHLRPIRFGPNGPNVQLDCFDCHRPAAVDAKWSYADPVYVRASTSYSGPDELLPVKAEILQPRRPASGRELMAPVRFADACAGCHLLTFDRRFDNGVPHDKPEIIHAFLVKDFQEYIAAHPGEVRVKREPSRDLTGKAVPPEVRILTPSQWVTERTSEAEELLWRKTCKQCHTLTVHETNSLPVVAAANTTARWMPHARFDHSAHTGFACLSCHEKALTSTETSDVLIPGIATCKACHAPGPDHAESRCFECHTYHDWSKRKEVTPKFTLPSLSTGGR
ncbi:MAG TPA: hypothetical protein VH110_04750 [Candidatus Acidoferrum sp.]|nr:hypothetical protein [Candidatus Acidoferrum sp.]